jgi:hypothetical protein
MDLPCDHREINTLEILPEKIRNHFPPTRPYDALAHHKSILFSVINEIILLIQTADIERILVEAKGESAPPCRAVFNLFYHGGK